MRTHTQTHSHVHLDAMWFWRNSLCKGAGRFCSLRLPFWRWQRSFPMSRLRLPFPASPPRHVPWILNIFCQVRVSSDYAFQSVAIFFMCVWFGAAVQTSSNLPWPVCFAKSNEGAAFSTRNWLISDSRVWTQVTFTRMQCGSGGIHCARVPADFVPCACLFEGCSGHSRRAGWGCLSQPARPGMFRGFSTFSVRSEFLPIMLFNLSPFFPNSVS